MNLVHFYVHMQKGTTKTPSITGGQPTLVVIDEDDLDEDSIEAPPFSPISVDENFATADQYPADGEGNFSLGDPESTNFNDDDDIESIDALVIYLIQSACIFTICSTVSFL